MAKEEENSPCLNEISKSASFDRPCITTDQINNTNLVLMRKLKDRLNEKGCGSFVSRHEILGVLTEEYDEVIKAVHSGTLFEIENELLDVAVGCLFGAACIRAGLDTLEY